MPIALLAGAFGQGNLGDDALLQAFVNALPEWHLQVTAADPVAVELMGCEPIPSRPAAVAAAARASDAIVVGGGTVFKTLHPSSGRRPLGLLANTAALVAVSSALHRPVAMVGVGAGRLDGWTARALARFIVKHADLLVLRDEESAAEMFRSDVPGPFRIGADPAWTLVAPPDRVPPARHGAVRVIPSHLATGTDGWSGMVDRLSDTLGRLLSMGLAVELQAWQHGGGLTDGNDVAIIDTLVDRLGPSVEKVPTPGSMEAAVESMMGTGTVLSFRFHALIAAAAAGVPTVAVTHEAKLGALARRLEQRAAPVDFEPGLLAAQVAGAVGAASPSPAAIKEQIARAEEGFLLLRVLLGGGRTEESDSLGALPLAPAPRTSATPPRVR
jgi:polysaccharide pyruvyl transferase WcaK-like protein